MLEWLEGKKTYIIGALLILGALVFLFTKLDLASVPDFVWLLLNGLGLGAIRAGIDAVSPNKNKGWKTYAAGIAIVVLSLLKIFGVDFPVEILVGLEGLGIVGIRNALEKIG